MHFLHSFFPPVIHRDLKSPNILLCELHDMQAPVIAKVADFGLSSVAASSLQGGADVFSPWQPPEVLLLKEYDESADVYSYGVVLWELCTALKPFDDYSFKNIMEKRKAINNGLRPAIPDNVAPSYRDLIEGNQYLFSNSDEGVLVFSSCRINISFKL
tara:strand:+ start:228 stop:701 length:474 start_codon:yes stop_codon:yes gene_type:complete